MPRDSILGGKKTPERHLNSGECSRVVDLFQSHSHEHYCTMRLFQYAKGQLAWGEALDFQAPPSQAKAKGRHRMNAVMYRLVDSGTPYLRDPPADAHVTVACRWFG